MILLTVGWVTCSARATAEKLPNSIARAKSRID
jgi:hypothetical protein